MGLLDKLKEGLKKSREGFLGRMDYALAGRGLDEETLESLEEILLTSDVGVTATDEIISHMRAKEAELRSYESVRAFLRAELASLLGEPRPLVVPEGQRPYVILVAGVNGVGKTTTIGKLASRFTGQGLSVMLAASDTFRAAAIEQLEVWAERAGAKVLKHQSGADPAAVAFDTVEAAKARGVDVVLVDTAGRLHTKTPLMEEIKKVRRVVGKALPGAPHEVLLVLDATTGQNALSQARIFGEAIGVTGVALTKLDGTARGGIIFALSREFGLPIRLIGIGEGIGDLRDFEPGDFVDALFGG